MLHMNASFFNIAAAIIFCLLGFLFGVSLVSDQVPVITLYLTDMRFSIVLSGLMFIMAYFSIKNLRHQ